MENNGVATNVGAFEIKDIFAIIANNLLQIIIVSVLFGFSAFFFTNGFVANVYQAEATAALKISESANSTKITYADTLLTQQLVDTYSIILKSDEVISSVKSHLNLPVSVEKLKDMITTSGIKNTQIIKISVQDNDPNRAKRIVNQILLDAPGIVDRNFEGASLVPVNAAKEGDLIYPNAFLNMLIALFLGAGLVIVIELLKEFLDDTIKSDEQIKQMFGITVLGLLPEIRGDKKEEDNHKTDKSGLEAAKA